jgi:hypothetical protein
MKRDSDTLSLGGIYRTDWDTRPFRVIGFDHLEVFYDCLWDHDHEWTFSDHFNKKCHFYRTSFKVFKERSVPIDHMPLTEQELHYFRPDLPMRVCRSRELHWNGFPETDPENLGSWMERVADRPFQRDGVPTDKLVLIPFGKKGGLKRGIIVNADGSGSFSASELILKAKRLQEAVNQEKSEGIGIYRLGFEKGLPSYAIGEYRDTAGIIPT